MKYSIGVMATCLILFAGISNAAEESIHCAIGHELKAALAGVTAGTTFHVSGTCYGPININSDDLLLVGQHNGVKAVLKNSPFLTMPQNIVAINNSTGVWITGFEIRNGLTGVTSTENASFTLDNVDFRSNVNNLMLNNASTQLINVSLGHFQK